MRTPFPRKTLLTTASLLEAARWSRLLCAKVLGSLIDESTSLVHNKVSQVSRLMTLEGWPPITRSRSPPVLLARATTALESKSRGFSSASFEEAMVDVEVDRCIDETSASNGNSRLSTRPRPKPADRDLQSVCS